MINTKQYKFEPGAWSIIQMGEELIGHPTTAINELVKNGYDADATLALVYLNYSKDNSKSFIVVWDNGLGMNSTTLFGEWLQPSVSSKRLGIKKSKIFERNFLGSKGIGRLAAMALGKYLMVITKTAQESSYNWLSIDRQAFKEESLLSKIEFPGGTSSSIIEILKENKNTSIKIKTINADLNRFLIDKKLINFTEGTVIIIENLDDSIRTIIEDEFLDGEVLIQDMSLLRSLRILITPLLLNPTIQDELIQKEILKLKTNISLSESTFDIYFGSNLLRPSEELFQAIKIEEFSILSNYDYRILGKVNIDGSVNGLYTCNRLIEDSFETKFVLTNNEVFSDESLRFRNIGEISKNEIAESKVGEFFFDIRIYDRDPDAMEKLSNILKTSGRRQTGYILDDIVGLRISKNGFGIKPYGEEEKDWMGLSQMRIQDPSVMLGTNQLIGNIFLFSPENDSLSEKTNREGFFENEAFITFKKILRSILIEVGKRRFNYRQKHNIGRKFSSKHERPDTTRYIDLIKSLTSDEKIITKAKKYVEQITTTLDNLENSLSFSQRLATLGGGLELVYHEMAQPISIIGKSLFSLKFPIGRIVEITTREEILVEIKHIKSSIGILDKLKESLEPAIGISKKSTFKPFETFNKICYLFTKDLLSLKIKLIIDENIKNYEVKDFEYNLWISFLNILNNAVYWLKSSNISDKTIYFSLGKNNEIIISNNGPLIEQDELENIFNYGVTHKKEKNATGLGLSFTKSILTTNDWDIWAENFPYGPAFLIKKQI
jgi:hypothetical protein